LQGANVDSDVDDGTERELATLLRALEQGRTRRIGLLTAGDFDYRELAPFFEHELNNAGDPEDATSVSQHTKGMEREVVGFFADLFRAPGEDRWGYVTTGGTEGNTYGLYVARSLYPDGLVYLSEAAHPSVRKAADLLGLRVVTVRTTDTGELDYDDLRRAVDPLRDRPAIVVASIGTAMTEAVDDVGHIKRVLGELALPDHYVHSDAALAGLPLALLGDPRRFDLADGADSICVSGHKFIGTPFPCGVVVTRRSLRNRIGRAVAYAGTPDTTIGGSRNGHAALLLWYALRRYGVAGLRQRAEQAREVAEYALRRLTEIGWPAWRNPHAFTVMLKTPPAEFAARWMLASVRGWSHLVCLPGVTPDQVDRFVTELHDAVRVPAKRSGPAGREPAGRPRVRAAAA
jgi:histidine decarboxylase